MHAGSYSLLDALRPEHIEGKNVFFCFKAIAILHKHIDLLHLVILPGVHQLSFINTN